MRRRGTFALLAALVAATLAVPAATAGPLDPRGADDIRLWLVERSGTAPRTLSFPVKFTVRNERSMLFSVGFERRDGARDFHDAQHTGFFLNAGGAGAPRVYAEGRGQLTPCAASVACTEPSATATTYTMDVTFGRYPSRLSMYLVAVNLDVRQVGTPAGWTLRELPKGGGASVQAIRQGTGVDTNVVAGIDRFTNAAAAPTRGPSIALGVIPCPWGPSGPTGPGTAVLDGGGALSRDFPRYDDRHPSCGRLEIGRAANARPTTWHLHGDAEGFLVAPFHLVVLELPPTG